MGRTVVVGRVGDIPEGGNVVVEVDGQDVAVFHVGGAYYAIDDRCPHAGASLSGGCVEDGVVTCPWHYWRFRLSDGAWADNPRIRTATFPVHVVGNEVRLEVRDRT